MTQLIQTIVANILRLFIRPIKRNDVPFPDATRKLTLPTTPEDPRDYKVSLPTFAEPSYPKKHIISIRPPIRNQGSIGSCASHAAVRCVETMIMNTHPNKFLELSELYHYYYARVDEGTFPNDRGQTLRTACSTALDHGIGLEYAWPYDVRKLNVEPNQTAKWFANLFTPSAYRKVVLPSDIFTIIASNTPILTGIDVNTSFYTLNEQKYEYNGSGTFVGGHAVVIIGYEIIDTNNVKLYFDNSWGESFGLKGSFTIDLNRFNTLSAKYGSYVLELQDGKTWGTI